MCVFFCKRRKPKNVFCATEVLSTPCACSPYFTILNSGTRGVEGIRWWGASLLGIINSGAGANPVTGGHRWAHTDTWHQPSTITLLLLLFFFYNYYFCFCFYTFTDLQWLYYAARSGALSFGTGCSFTRATNHFTTLIWSLTIFPVPMYMFMCYSSLFSFTTWSTKVLFEHWLGGRYLGTTSPNNTSLPVWCHFLGLDQLQSIWEW